MAEPERMTLAVDCSVRNCGIAVLASPTGGLWDSRLDLSGVASLVGGLRELLQRSQGGLGEVVVARGPGSYIGVRSGLAAAVGLAQVQSLPLRVLGSLQVVAARVEWAPGVLLAVSAAGRGGRYAQQFHWDSIGLQQGWVPCSEAIMLASTQHPPRRWRAVDHRVDPDRVGLDLSPTVLEPVRSRPEALALLAGLGAGTASGYDLVSADYGVRLGEAT